MHSCRLRLLFRSELKIGVNTALHRVSRCGGVKIGATVGTLAPVRIYPQS